MRKLQDIVEDGFIRPSNSDGFGDTALMSLRIALKAYFDTYQSQPLIFYQHVRDGSFGRGVPDQSGTDKEHLVGYRQDCVEVILHMQHFAELVCKDMLRRRHPLLADDAHNKPIIYDKLLMGESLTDDDERAVKSVEFTEAFRRLCTLLDEHRLDSRYEFVLRHKGALEKLNIVRNRMWHRGVFILRYPALDELMVRHVLPFVQDVVNLKEYAKHKGWRHRPLNCGIDPLAMVIDQAKSDPLNYDQVAWLTARGFIPQAA